MHELFIAHHDPLLEMTAAGLESVFFRQDSYTTGGIVESDGRVDGGRALYSPWCWPRTEVVRVLLALGEFVRVRKFLEFFLCCQRPDGGWLHCYDVRDGREFPGWEETDNIGYFLCHFHDYVAASGDLEFLELNRNAVRRAVTAMKRNFNPVLSLVRGVAEANPPGHAESAVRYALQVNAVCTAGFQAAAELLDPEYAQIARAIRKHGIGELLWNESSGAFAFGLDDSGNPVMEPALWLSLMPFRLFPDYDDRLPAELDWLKARLFNRDPLIPESYWLYDLSPYLDGRLPLENRYSGLGVWVGAIPVLIVLLLRVGREAEAAQQLELLIKLTSRENHLIPEHINTVHSGELGNYRLYPDPASRVDSGNLLHLSFFLTMILECAPGILHKSYQQIKGNGK